MQEKKKRYSTSFLPRVESTAIAFRVHVKKSATRAGFSSQKNSTHKRRDEKSVQRDIVQEMSASVSSLFVANSTISHRAERRRRREIGTEIFSSSSPPRLAVITNSSSSSSSSSDVRGAETRGECEDENAFNRRRGLLGASLFTALVPSDFVYAATSGEPDNVYDFTVSQYGKPFPLSKYKGKVTVIVNVASE